MSKQAAGCQKAQELSDRILEGCNALVSFTQNLSDEQWESPVLGDGRSIGVVTHHVATVYPTEVMFAKMLAHGKAIKDLTKEAIDQANAEHAATNAYVDRNQTIELLKANAQTAANEIRQLTEDELNNWAHVSLYYDAPLTCQFFIEDHALRHSFHHLGKIKASV